MSSISEHYETHLAPIYVWMMGGLELAMARGRSEVEAACTRPPPQQWAVDLGAGFGMHAVPLAELGYSVLAIDSSRTLLEVLANHAATLPIKIVEDDLLSFKRHLDAPAALIVCMGDTLTHLPDRPCVERLFDAVADVLSPNGTFVVSFRDYSIPLIGPDRFIPVRHDADRILTCFLEYEDGAVTVHDILHERGAAGWRQRVSAYRKLRLAPDWVAGALETRGFHVRREAGLAGMIRLIARRPRIE